MDPRIGSEEFFGDRLRARDPGFGECAGFVHEMNKVVQPTAWVEERV